MSQNKNEMVHKKEWIGSESKQQEHERPCCSQPNPWRDVAQSHQQSNLVVVHHDSLNGGTKAEELGELVIRTRDVYTEHCTEDEVG